MFLNTNLIWFRNDLRIRDNPALYTACQDKRSKVIAIYIATPQQWEKHSMSPKQASFIFKNLISLQKELVQFGITFYYHASKNFLTSVCYLIKFCLKQKVNNVFINYEYPINEFQRDILAKKKLLINKIHLYGFHGNMLVSPAIIKNSHGGFYQKYFAFKQHLIKYLKTKKNYFYSIPQKKLFYQTKLIQLSPFQYPTETFNENLFPIGEKKALFQLKKFCKNQMNCYNNTRNYPYLDTTSLLSAQLSIGVLSIKQCLFYLIKAYPETLYLKKESIWLNELIWREFYHYLIAVFPDLSKNKPFLKWSVNLPWNHNIEYLDAWKKGKTGFPIVDAGMRQLNLLGWMHNRLRMITSSFLVKNLLIDWKEGQQYFMSKLIDGNFASNNGNWQWIASTGTDSVPYFRIFNPEIQSKKFDISGNFIRKYVPELEKVPESVIHSPFPWIKKQLFYTDYPAPIIDYNLSRKKTLSIFKNTRNTYDKKNYL